MTSTITTPAMPTCAKVTEGRDNPWEEWKDGVLRRGFDVDYQAVPLADGGEIGVALGGNQELDGSFALTLTIDATFGAQMTTAGEAREVAAMLARLADRMDEIHA